MNSMYFRIWIFSLLFILFWFNVQFLTLNNSLQIDSGSKIQLNKSHRFQKTPTLRGFLSLEWSKNRSSCPIWYRSLFRHLAHSLDRSCNKVASWEDLRWMAGITFGDCLACPVKAQSRKFSWIIKKYIICHKMSRHLGVK